MFKIFCRTLLILVWIWFLSAEGWAYQDKPVELHEGLSLLSKQLIGKRANIGRRKIAVTDVSSLYGEKGNLGAFIAEEMMSLMAGLGAQLLERRLLDESLKELRLNMTDLVDPKSAKHLGLLTGTELLLLGTVTEFEDTIKINARLIDIETLKIVSVGEILIKKDKYVLKLMGIPYPGSILVISTPSSIVFLDGESVGNTSWRGRLNISEVKPGGHSLRIDREGYRSITEWANVREDTETKVEAYLIELPNPATAVVLSLLFPGGGDIYLGHDDWWRYTIGVWGSVYGAIYYSKRTKDLVWVEDDNGKHIEKRGESPMYAFAALAAGIWIYDLEHVASSANALRYNESATIDANGFKIVPCSEGAKFFYRWTW